MKQIIWIEYDVMPLTKGNKLVKPTSLFGIWRKKPRELDKIRTKAWKR